jgi:hypothetical protein
MINSPDVTQATTQASNAITSVVGRIKSRASKIFHVNNNEDLTSTSAQSKNPSINHKHRSINLRGVQLVDNPSIKEGEYDELDVARFITVRDWEKVYDRITVPLIENYNEFFASTQFILDLFDDWKESFEKLDRNEMNRSDKASNSSNTKDSVTTDELTVSSQSEANETNQTISAEAIAALLGEDAADIPPPKKSGPAFETCLFVTDKEHILSRLKECSKLRDASLVLDGYISVVNGQLMKRWTLVFTAVRKLEEPVRRRLFSSYRDEILAFWKLQMMTHTRR